LIVVEYRKSICKEFVEQEKALIFVNNKSDLTLIFKIRGENF